MKRSVSVMRALSTESWRISQIDLMQPRTRYRKPQCCLSESRTRLQRSFRTGPDIAIDLPVKNGTAGSLMRTTQSGVRRSRLTPEEVAAISAYGAKAVWPSGFQLYQRGASADGVFIVLEGH